MDFIRSTEMGDLAIWIINLSWETRRDLESGKMCSVLDTRLFLFPLVIFRTKEIEKKKRYTAIENTILQLVYFAGKSLKFLNIHCFACMKFLREISDFDHFDSSGVKDIREISIESCDLKFHF